MKRKVFSYGILLAGLVSILKYVEYNYWIKTISQENYIGLIALTFTLIGVYLGFQWVNTKPRQVAFEEKNNHYSSQLNITSREMEVLIGIKEGLTNAEIGEKLFLSENTIKTHASNLFSKLGVNRRTKAIRKSIELGIVE